MTFCLKSAKVIHIFDLLQFFKNYHKLDQPKVCKYFYNSCLNKVSKINQDWDLPKVSKKEKKIFC